ncbi:MAG: recombinase family protein [Rhizobiaceae bacterium]|jgi:DNA invertase Pin-like site-specific DNA recombinase
MTDRRPAKALIYCRVSTTKQEDEGNGLESQEMRCRQYAQSMGYEVEAVFPDSVSGGGDFMKRPGMVALLSYLDAQPGTNGYVVIFDDLKRFARDTEFHIRLRQAFRLRGARVECLNFRFEETPEGKFTETILAAQGELEREQNRRQVIQKMQAHTRNGHWLFYPPIGYRFEEVPNGVSRLVRDEPLASIVQHVFESYASGVFQTQAEIVRYLEDQPAWPRGPKGTVHWEQVARLLTRPIYAGLITVPKWNIHLVPGVHEALVSIETWTAVQDRRQGAAKAPARKDLSQDFPLRGFVLCACCNEPLTAGWSKGRYRRYPYYLCDTKGCPEYRKSIRKEDIERDFDALLACLVPSQGLFHLAFDMLRDLWNHKLGSGREEIAAWQNNLRSIEKKIDQLIDRLVETTSDTVIAAYEKRVRDLEIQKALANEKIANCGRPLASFGETYRTAMEFLANPWKLWRSDRLEDRRAVLKLVFAERLPYARKNGYRTGEISMPFKLLGDMRMHKSEMVPLAGIEPARP